MKNLMIRICTFILISNIAFAQDAMVIPIKKSEVAPFDGILMNKKAAAQVMTFMETADVKCRIELTELSETKDLECSTQKTLLQNNHNRETTVFKSNIDSLEQQLNLANDKIKLVESEKTKEWWSGFWFGTATGIIVTGLTTGVIYLAK